LKIAVPFIRVALNAVLASTLTFSAQAWAADGYVYDVVGYLSVAVGKNAPHQALKNDAVTSDTALNTGDKSYAVLKFADGQVATMQANSSFYVSDYRYDPKLIENDNIVFSKFKGGMRFITGLIGQRNHQTFKLSTTNATIGILGTDFEVATFKGALYCQVLSGSISMTNSAGMVIFKAGQTIQVKTAHTMPREIPATALPAGIFSQLDAIPTPPAALPDAGATAIEKAATGVAVGATAAISGPALSAGATAATSLPSGAAATPSARTISITGAGATYTGADMPCDFCTGRTNTVATHTEAAADTAAGNPVTGDSSMFGKHNLTPSGANTGEICAFCHTPQGDEDKVSSPRWNRTLTTLSSYRAFSSMGSATQEASGSISMSCLSCHDGGQAPNIVINSPSLHLNVGDVQVDIGNDLKNHHPVGVQYGGGGQNQYAPDIPLNPIAARDRLSEMNNFATGNKFSSIFSDWKPLKRFNARNADAMADVLTSSNEGMFDTTKGGFNKSTYSGTGSGTVWWVKSPGSQKMGRQKTDLYLFTRADTIDTFADESIQDRPYVECATCHDPHSTNSTFLRTPGGNARSQVCLTCHNK
jgi:predicted CXXCH cytochrome family protein